MSETLAELEEAYKAALHDIEQRKKDAAVLKRKKELAAAHQKREKVNRHQLPPGFVITYNDRRGDPQFDPYYQLSLLGKDGDVAHWWKVSKDSEQAAEARAELLDHAWFLVDLARLILSYQGYEGEK